MKRTITLTLTAAEALAVLMGLGEGLCGDEGDALAVHCDRRGVAAAKRAMAKLQEARDAAGMMGKKGRR